MRVSIFAPVTLAATCALHLSLSSFVTMQDTPKLHIRFFNDSVRAANFYVDGKFACSVPANPEENDAYCDAEAAAGRHTVGVKVEKLSDHSCQLNVIHREGVEPGAEAHLSKGDRFRCISYAYDEGL
jgi:hypothetical protein